MLDFGKWFAQQGAQEPAAVAEEPELPFGVWQRYDGTLAAVCNSCGCAYELPCDPAEFDQEMSYCGGSPHCLP